MTHFDNLRYALNFILDLPTAREGDAEPPSAISWLLDIVDSNDFAADLNVFPSVDDPKVFKVSISKSVWPRLEAFCACGMDLAVDSTGLAKSFSYSDDQLETLIRLTEDRTEWGSIQSKVEELKRIATTQKRITFPISLIPANQTSVPIAAACCGFFWLLGHESTHAWKTHYKLQNVPFRESVRKLSRHFDGLGLDRTLESEADWQSAKFLYAYILDCVQLGYDPALAYVAGFGIVAAILLLNPSRHELWERAEQQDPGWMRVHFIQGAAKAAGWWVTQSYYPEYVEQFARRGMSGLLRHHPKNKAPDSRFSKKCDEAFHGFWRGQYDALRFAQAIGDANQRQQIVDRTHFKFGDPSDWKEFQIMVMESDVLKLRESARKKLRECLPEDPRFNGLALSYDGYLRLGILASKNLPQDSPLRKRTKSNSRRRSK